MERGLQGYLLPQSTAGESFRSFVPRDLPPDSPLTLDSSLHDRLEQANRAVGRLDGISLLLPDLFLFLYFYVRKEAVLSSQIEGTQSSLSDLLLYESREAPGVPIEDVIEVSNYVAAQNLGLERLRAGEPISARLLRDMHARLLGSGRGSDRLPGEFRTSQNWVGGTRPGNAIFVPPPPGEVGARIAALIAFLEDKPARTPTLIKAALAHAQFETIHPFLDGNGRLGRLLITLLLCHDKALGEPLLYLSLYFKTNRAAYYEQLQRVRLAGDWEGWLDFFLCGVEETAGQAASAAQQIVRLFKDDRDRIQAVGRRAGSMLRVHHLLQQKPLISIPNAAKELGLSKPTVGGSMSELADMGIVRPIPAERGSLYIYGEYLRILGEGTEPLQ